MEAFREIGTITVIMKSFLGILTLEFETYICLLSFL